jgi:hypothetical protein
VPTWQPVVEQRPHPLGEAGVRSSLDEVAKKAADILKNGDHFVRVKTWAGKKLHEARARGEDVSTDRGRAAALLRVVQREKLWVPDPVGMEFITGAHLMACDRDADNPEGVCVQAEDCDGKTVLLTACYLSIGLHTVICGHGYDKEHPRVRRLEHVISKVRAGGEWYYADGSYEEFALGTCHPFTRERILSLPDRRVVCDGEVCNVELGGYDPDDQFLKAGAGTYIGVDGISSRPLRVVWLGSEEEPTPYEAAWEKAKERNFGTSKEDVKAYGAAAGAVGGAAACCATGAGCVAAPACAWIGGEIGGRIAEAIYDLFSGDKATGIASNQNKDWKAIWGSGERRDAFRMFALGCVEELRGKPIQFTDSNLKAQDVVLAPAMVRLRQWPWKNGVPAPKAGETWSAWVGRVGTWVSSPQSYGMNLWATMTTATNQYQAALTASSGGIIGERAGEQAKASQSSGSSSTTAGTLVKVGAGIGALWGLGKLVGLL